MKQWTVRLSVLFLFGAIAWYVPWLLMHLNMSLPWLSWPFAAANLLVTVMVVITALNCWRYAEPPLRPLPQGDEEPVAVIIPTYGEPPQMVYNTVKSVLDQDYPLQQMRIIVSDDGHSERIKNVVARLREEYPEGYIGYHEPPRKGDPARKGEAKAGNLNSAFDAVRQYAPEVSFIETRDADDLVGDRSFLRHVVGQLVADPRLAFVQTIKEVTCSPGDPFGNREPIFYRRTMLAKNAANAVFPCGSGVVWRREALEDIGGFPAWNLVEDLQSGVEALRRGWRGLYLPIVGAVGQIAPEDIPNAFKQRGTWALDTMRLTLWGNKRGLSLGQHIQFAELGFFYLMSFAVLVFAVVPCLKLTFNLYPLSTTEAEYMAHFWPFAIGIELLLAGLSLGLSFEELWRARMVWIGMSPVYARAVVLALVFGPHRKPSYRVTRKEHVHAWYWRETWPQMAIMFALAAASLYHLATHSLLDNADLGSLFWAGFFIVGFSRIVRNSWFGLNPLREIARSLRRVWQPLGAQARAPWKGSEWAVTGVQPAPQLRKAQLGQGLSDGREQHPDN